MKLKVTATFIYDTDCLINPDDFELAKNHIENCGYFRKISDDSIEDLKFTVIEKCDDTEQKENK